MLRYLFVLYLTLGLLVGAGFLSTAQAQREGCIPAVCENDSTCNCFNQQADRRGCLVQECEEGGPICSCAYISNRGNPYGMHIRLTQCLPNDVFNGEGPEHVYADCREGKEIPIITEELHCQRECVVGGDGPGECETNSDCGPGERCDSPPGGTCVPTSPEDCSDGIDNDGDGLIDCADAVDCELTPECEGCFPNPCADGEFCSPGPVCLPVP